MKILGIDDNLDIDELLFFALNAYGHEFSYVQNGKEGIEKIRHNSYDLVLLDVAMPEFSGMDVLESLGREELIGKQKIVLFTASDILDEEKNDLLKKGVTAFIKKPIDLNTLLQKLDELNNMTCKGTVNLSVDQS